MTNLLMPRATAVWLIENTTLTFEQIGNFCKMHELEIGAIANGENSAAVSGLDPIINGQLTDAEIKRCQTNSSAKLKILQTSLPQSVKRQKGARYTPVSKRADKPAAIAWCLKHHPNLTDAQLRRLIGTTKQTILAIRDRTHWNYSNLVPRNPADLGLCRYEELLREVEVADEITKKNAPSGEILSEMQVVTDMMQQ